MTSTITIRKSRFATAVVGVGLLTFAGACGTEPSTERGPVERPPAAASFAKQGSPDSIERKLAAEAVPQGSPDSIERRLAASQTEASCRVSADTAERLGANACVR